MKTVASSPEAKHRATLPDSSPQEENIHIGHVYDIEGGPSRSDNPEYDDVKAFQPQKCSLLNSSTQKCYYQLFVLEVQSRTAFPALSISVEKK